MQRIIPSAYILTSAAIDEMQRADAEWLRLKDQYERLGLSHGVVWTAMGDRTTQLYTTILSAIASGALAALIVTRTEDGWDQAPPPADYWDTPAGTMALVRGAVVSEVLHDKDRRGFEGDALCFKRSEWTIWLSALSAELRPGHATPEWWTVPQGAAWIRARDYDLVRGLDPRAELPMAAAGALVPGAWEARHLLKAALAHDRFSAQGRLARREITNTGGASWHYLETDAARIPLSFWTTANGDFAIHSDGVSAIEPGELVHWADVTIAADDCVAHWPEPLSLLEGGSVRLTDIVAALQPEDCLAWWLSHPDVTVTGLDAAGVRVPIDRDIFRGQFTIDRDGNSLTAEGFRWPSVMVCLTGDAAGAAVSAPLIPSPAAETAAGKAPKVSRKRGPPARRRAAVVAWIAKHYPPPSGVPEGVTVAALQTEMKADTAACGDVRAASEDTIRRALERKK